MICTCKTCESTYRIEKPIEINICKFCGTPIKNFTNQTNLSSPQKTGHPSKAKDWWKSVAVRTLILILGCWIFLKMLDWLPNGPAVVFVLFGFPVFFLTLINWTLIKKKWKQKNDPEYQKLKENYHSYLKKRFPGIKPEHNQVQLLQNLFLSCSFIGNYDYDGETDSYVTFQFISILMIPIFPIRAYRVSDPKEGVEYDSWIGYGRQTGKGWIILGKVPMIKNLNFKNMKTIMWVQGIAAIVIAIIFLTGSN